MSDTAVRRGRTIRMFLVEGSTAGLIIVEIVNWTGMAIVVQRSALADFLKRTEAQKASCYILAGSDPDDPFRPLVYVGESETIGKRLREHDADEKKAFFQRAIVFISKDENLTKAHVRHLEEQLTRRIQAAGRTTPMHSNEPGGAALPEADRSDMDYYLDQVEIILPALGLDILRRVPSSQAQSRTSSTQVEELSAPHSQFVFNVGDVRANAVEVGGEFIVLKGSKARVSEAPSLPETYRARREKLKAEGTLSISNGDNALVFNKDMPFDSPTAAAAVVYGASISGPANWRLVTTDETYAQFRKRSLAEAARDSDVTTLDDVNEG